ncbi:addiction module antidote protein, HigA family [Macrococcoides bohemicum]|uniref:Addiction module antidote protein, HigA family n=1 Tax=Macrococcoides bohemicum TaxID=1903056 RepID=A0A328AC68_9STAP|nr:HigA family addiction module antitoxin [Macrococcus bohemicus]RAK50458.1 addiction module antidote protein, HigA family [Macrococcus bohemicus]
MVDKLVLEYNDQMAFHPGVYIQDSLDDLDMTQRELATRLDTSAKNVSEIVNGLKSVNPKMALNLSKVFKVDSQTWLNLQAKYDALKMEIEQNEHIKEQIPLLSHIDYTKLVKLGIVAKHRKGEDKIKELCKIFKIASLDVLKEREIAINFRATELEKESHVINTNLWIEMVTLKASKELPLEFNKEILENSISYLRSLTNEEPALFIPEITRTLREAGIHFILMPSLKNAKPKGMVMWRDGKITLAMSNKGKYADMFWFTFFHEIGHILMHPTKNFIELDGKSVREKEADTFARNTLIPDVEYNDFTTGGDFSFTSINAFAESMGINPTIVIGRLQNDNIIPYYHFTDKKAKYTWAFEKD